MLKGMRRLLKQHGYDTIPFETAKALRDYDDFNQAFCIVLDVNLSDGREAIFRADPATGDVTPPVPIGVTTTADELDPDDGVTSLREAIRQAVQSARAGDVVVVAGRGHERTQLIGDAEQPFSDVEEVERLLGGG